MRVANPYEISFMTGLGHLYSSQSVSAPISPVGSDQYPIGNPITINPALAQLHGLSSAATSPNFQQLYAQSQQASLSPDQTYSGYNIPITSKYHIHLSTPVSV